MLLAMPRVVAVQTPAISVTVTLGVTPGLPVPATFMGVLRECGCAQAMKGDPESGGTRSTASSWRTWRPTDLALFSFESAAAELTARVPR